MADNDKISTLIMEIANDSQSINVGINPNIDVSVLTADDPNPMFVNVETIRTGISKTNRRRYSPQIVHQVSEMTPGLQGYLGHPDPSKTSFEFREPQCIFVGSTVQEFSDGSVRAVAKAYIFKSSPLREWIPKSIAAKNPITVSINAVGDVSRDIVNDVIDVISIKQLDSIDWANPGTEGMFTSKAMNVVSEMQDKQDKGGNSMENKEQIIKGTSIAELKAYNPTAITEVLKSTTISELQSANPELVKVIAETGKISEMQLSIDGTTKIVKFTEMQGLLDSKDSKIAELQNYIDTQKITEYRNKKLNELVPEGLREKISKRIVGKTEADIDKSIEAEMAYVQEIAGSSNSNIPRGNGARKDTGDMAEKIKAMFGVKTEKSE